MTPYIGASARHVNAHHLSSSLLFQFILADFIEAFGDIQVLDQLYHQKPISIPDHPYQIYNLETTSQVENILKKLVGSQKNDTRLIAWNFREGILTRLKTHCSFFSQNADNDEKELMAMQHYVDKVWQHCMQAMDVLSESPDKRSLLYASLEKASGAMHRFAKLIARVIQQFRDDENVVFFLLRHKHQIDKLYGRRYINKLLCRMYPKGLREVRHFLINKYTERHFEHLLPTISTMISEIEASAL